MGDLYVCSLYLNTTTFGRFNRRHALVAVVKTDEGVAGGQQSSEWGDSGLDQGAAMQVVTGARTWVYSESRANRPWR